MLPTLSSWQNVILRSLQQVAEGARNTDFFRKRQVFEDTWELFMEKRKLDDAVSEKFRLDEDETLNDKVICAARIDSYFKNN